MKSTCATKPASSQELQAVHTVRGMVRAARGSATQKEFGIRLGGVDQALVSRYESGDVDPPAKVIEACMQVLRARDDMHEFSAKAIAHRIQTELQGDEHSDLRRAFVYMLDGLKPRKVGRPAKPKV